MLSLIMPHFLDDCQQLSLSIRSILELNDLAEELKADVLKMSDLDFKFDEEHHQLFLENANALAPLIPSMIP